MTVRRIVTARNSEGVGVFAPAENGPTTCEYAHTPGMSTTQIWATPPLPSLPAQVTDPVAKLERVIPPVGGTQFMFVTFAPDSVMQSADFDGRAAYEEYLKNVPGLAECFEPESPGMHTTDTIDYGVVLDGEIWLDLGDGRMEHLRRNDVSVQHGTRHAWRNRSERPTLMAFVLIGARRS